MTVDEKRLEAAARAIDPKAWHDWDNRNFPRDLPRHLDNRGHRLTPSLDSARAAITAYESARSAEPVASEIGEEEIARATQIIACVMARDNHAIARATAEMVLSLLQPALERARREGYAIGFGASAEGYNSEYPFDGDFADAPEWQAVRETEIAAAIRKESGG